MAVAAFNKNKSLSINKLESNLTKKHVKCYIWSTALYDALTRTLWKGDQKYLGSFDMWCWRRMEIIRTDGGKMLQRTQGERITLRRMNTRQANRIGHILGRNCFLKHVIKGKIEGMGRLGRRRKQLTRNTLRFCYKNQPVYRKIITVSSEIHTKHINTFCRQKVEF